MHESAIGSCDTQSAYLHIRREATSDDWPAIAALFDRAASSDPAENATSAEEVASDLTRPQIDPRSIVLVERVGKLVGFSVLLVVSQGDNVRAHVWMQSDADSEETVDRALLRQIESHASLIANERHHPVEVLFNSPSSRGQRIQLLRANDYVVVRHFLRMSRVLTPDRKDSGADFPDGYTCRALMGDDEMAAWVALYNRAFGDHWHFAELSLDAATHFVRCDPNYRCDGDLICLDSSRNMIGMCQCVIRAAENKKNSRRDGWISLLGVAPSHRRRMLGSALLGAGLRWLTSQGMTTALLGVDAESSTGATALYERAGFGVIARRQCLSKLILPTNS